MKSAKLLSVLNGLSIIEKKYSEVNCGGCGAVALYISDELNKRDIKHDIVWIGDSFFVNKKLIKSILKSNTNVTLGEFNNNGIYLSHAMIRIRKGLNYYFVDATGVYNGFKNTEWKHRDILAKLKFEELKPLVDSADGWNEMFNRNDMPKIKTLVKDIMKKLDE
jgi:hypothetical protein